MNLPFPRSPAPAAPHRRGFYLVKKGFVRELNIAEIPVEPRVRSNLIPGRAQATRGRGCPAPPLVSHYPQQLLVFIFRIRSLPYVHVILGKAESETTEEMSRRA